MESASLFAASVLSLAVLSSMRYNPRRLEAFGYSFGLVFLQILIAGYEDVFFICPQFPIYVSPKDSNLNPDKTAADSKARGVYVDTSLLLARCTRVRTGTRDSVATAFANGYRDRDFNLFGKIDITSLEVPILEERKRATTRHPKDLAEHIDSIDKALRDAQRQVLAQAQILFSSRRFADQNLVILLATAGQYYRIAALRRNHPIFRVAPTTFEVEAVLNNQKKDSDDLGEDSEDFFTDLVPPSIIGQSSKQLQVLFAHEEEKRQTLALESYRGSMVAQNDEELLQSELIAGFPLFSDGRIESYHKLCLTSDEANYRRYPMFFEPKPRPDETIDSFADLKDPNFDNTVVFTGVIRVGSPVSDRFVELIRQYLSKLARNERSRRTRI